MNVRHEVDETPLGHGARTGRRRKGVADTAYHRAPAAGGCGRPDCCSTPPVDARPLLPALAWPLALGLGLAAVATALSGGDGLVIVAVILGLILGARVASARRQPTRGLTRQPADPIQSYCCDPRLSSEKEQQ